MICELFDQNYFPPLTPADDKRNKSVSVQGIRSKTDTVSYGLLYAYNFLQCEAGLMPGLPDKEKNLIQSDFAMGCGAMQGLPYFVMPYDVEGNFVYLPRYSWLLSLNIKLVEPFLSHGDDPFYPIENSVCRDGASGLPMIKSTTWKGNFLDAAYRLVPAQMPDYFSPVASWKEEDWKAKEKLLTDSLPKDRVQQIFDEHDGLANCPLFAIEELYEIACKKQGAWLRLRKEAGKDVAQKKEYEQHPLTVLHAMRGYPVQLLQKLCGTDDEIYAEVAKVNEKNKKCSVTHDVEQNFL